DLHRKRLQTLLSVDDLIGTLVDALGAAGQLQGTYIFFSSDNGFHLGEHRLPQGKNTAFEEDIRVPLIVFGPGVPAGRTVELLAMNIDLAPTWVAIAGVSPPSFVDGRSLLPVLSAAPPRQDRWRQMVLIEHYTPARAGRTTRAAAIPEYHALRVKDFSYVEYATGERELYDLRRDPYQLQNIYQSADQNFVSALSARLAALKQCVGATCRAAEDSTFPTAR
ncbi:MAG: sulfatase/phosphatase domain-containing protein, partial [bacterium]